MDTSFVTTALQTITELAVTWGPGALGAIALLFVGFAVVKKVSKLIRKGLNKSKIDATVATFLSNLLSFILKAMIVIAAAGMVGIQTTSFVAIIGAAGLAVGLALQGSLANFAGGVLILIFKPYQVGDWVEIDGEVGQVDEIDILMTTMITGDNKIVIIPNGEAANGTIVNRSKKGPMRVGVPVGIAYDESVDKAREVLLEAINDHPLTLKTPAPSVVVTELADSSVNLELRAYTDAKNYAGVYVDLMEAAKNALDAAKISIPFPHRVVHAIKD